MSFGTGVVIERGFMKANSTLLITNLGMPSFSIFLNGR